MNKFLLFLRIVQPVGGFFRIVFTFSKHPEYLLP